MFRFLADARAREVMTAAALLVVLGAALRFQFGGLSMAMGAFLAGVLLSTSTFRHQLEADVEPFRGILLGLFFLAVGMSLDLIDRRRQLADRSALMRLAYMLVEGGAIFAARAHPQVEHGRGAGACAADGAGRRVRVRALRHGRRHRDLSRRISRTSFRRRSSSRWC